MISKFVVFVKALAATCSLVAQVGRRVRQIEVVVNVLSDLVRNVDGLVHRVEFVVEVLHIHLRFVVRHLLRRVTIIILGLLLVEELLFVFSFLFFVLLLAKTQTHQHRVW